MSFIVTCPICGDACMRIENRNKIGFAWALHIQHAHPELIQGIGTNLLEGKSVNVELQGYLRCCCGFLANSTMKMGRHLQRFTDREVVDHAMTEKECRLNDLLIQHLARGVILSSLPGRHGGQ